MRVNGAQKRRVQHVRQANVVNIVGQPLDQPGIFRALDWFANCLFHIALPLYDRADFRLHILAFPIFMSRAFIRLPKVPKIADPNFPRFSPCLRVSVVKIGSDPRSSA
jgi:hypothetical protein